MKYSQIIGVVVALAIIANCFMPWSYVASQQITITGLKATGTSFGKPGLVNIVMSIVAIIFFLVPRIWSKRTNMFIAIFNFAWSIRNYILVTSCYLGDCPEKRAGIYLLLILSFVMFLMTLFPKIELKGRD
ncbi:hypothetical protein QTN47_10705 [Danxiaibacter flavus]|uniref:DUF4293 family protein n=1 Tax=Danxiaibacter flavus TaxID=3049108 RepID=A0ABV3ZDK6_9BACT|nr:hypothetical protein QNM32_10710 [Chitinophagaceae bacterium DXS]